MKSRKLYNETFRRGKVGKQQSCGTPVLFFRPFCHHYHICGGGGGGWRRRRDVVFVFVAMVRVIRVLVVVFAPRFYCLLKINSQHKENTQFPSPVFHFFSVRSLQFPISPNKPQTCSYEFVEYGLARGGEEENKRGRWRSLNISGGGGLQGAVDEIKL